MNKKLKEKLYLIALQGIIESNKGNPFITRKEAFIFFNQVDK